MDCKTAIGMVTPYIQGDLDMNDMEDFLEHVRSCPACREELEIYYIIYEGLKRLDSGSDNYNIKGALEGAIHNSYQQLGILKFERIIRYALNTLVVMSLVGTILVELRLLFF